MVFGGLNKKFFLVQLINASTFSALNLLFAIHMKLGPVPLVSLVKSRNNRFDMSEKVSWTGFAMF